MGHDVTFVTPAFNNNIALRLDGDVKSPLNTKGGNT